MNDFKTAKLDGLDILKDGVSGIYYTYKEWRKVSTSDDSQNIDGMHGRTTSPTYVRTRIITLEGYVDRLGNASEYEVIQYLEKMFTVQGNPGRIIPRVLYIKDIYDREWKMNVKVKEPIEILEGDSDFIGSHWKWRVVLESLEDPIYRSFEEIIETGAEGILGGFIFPFVFPDAWSESASVIECTTTGNISAPARIEITVVENITAPLTVYNITSNTYFGLNTSASPGDIIIIDGYAKTVTKNGVSILGERVSGSIWPEVESTTSFIIEDLDGGIESSGFTVNIFFSNSLL